MYKALDFLRDVRKVNRRGITFHQGLFERACDRHPLRDLHAYDAGDLISMKVSDPRDKVFAMRSQYPHTFGEVRVDYNRSVSSLFAETTRRMLQGHETPHILFEASRSPKLTNLPSWVVDWASDDAAERFWAYGALAFVFTPSGTSQSRISFSQNGENLYLKGRMVGTVGSSHIGPRFSYYETQEEDFIGCSPEVANSVLDLVSIWASGLATAAAYDLGGDVSAFPARTGTMHGFAKLLSLLNHRKDLKGLRLTKKNRPKAIKHWMQSH